MPAEDPTTMRRLRREVARVLPLGAPPDPAGLTAHELRALRRARFLDTEWRLRREPLPAEIEPEAPSEDGPVSEVQHRIEIALVAQGGQPYPGDHFEVTLADGRVRRGRLGAGGAARIEPIEAGGACEVTFPRVDEDAWEPV